MMDRDGFLKVTACRYCTGARKIAASCGYYGQSEFPAMICSEYLSYNATIIKYIDKWVLQLITPEAIELHEISPEVILEMRVRDLHG
jgi:hypothetical protein